jgi:acetylornithine deacetylase/succinyl-diaminopimelate desuccinylase-like protein
MLSVGKLKELAQGYQPRLITFLQDLVRISSVNGRDTEASVAHRVAEEATRLGLNIQLVAATPERPNVLIEWGQGPKGFALVGHLDTVAEGDPAAWLVPPFSAQIQDGRLYGRGTADNKAGIACGLYAITALRDSGWLDPAEVHLILAGVVDEESGASSPLGVRYLLDQGLLEATGAIYTYASDIICIGHRGLMRIILRATGKAIHTGSAAWSQRQGGVNAVTGLAAILVELEKLRFHAAPHPAFEGLGCTLTAGTLFHGGEYESMVPAQAEAMIDVRLMPGQSAEGVLAAIRQVIDAETTRRPGLSVSIEVKNNVPGAAIPPDHRLVQVAQQYAHAVTGRAWPVRGAGPTNEGYMLIGAGIPTLCGFGPRGDNAHAPNEWVELSSLLDTLAMYAGIIHDYLRD